MDTKEQTIKCTRCKVTLPDTAFTKKRCGNYQKRCKQCNARCTKGSKNCPHKKRRSRCKQCGGVGICKHSKVRNACTTCKGGSVCEHSRVRSQCKECKGGSVCEHSRQRSTCKDCGGSQICKHKKIRSICKKCKGGGICQHDKRRQRCIICDPVGHLKSVVRVRVGNALRGKKNKKSIEYLGCSIEEFKKHISSQFKEDMNWSNYGEWEIDHIVPIKYQNPSIDQVIERLHWSNTQPLWATDNASKGNRYIG